MDRFQNTKPGKDGIRQEIDFYLNKLDAASLEIVRKVAKNLSRKKA